MEVKPKGRKPKPPSEFEQAMERCIIAAKERGCPQDQVGNFLHRGVYLQPKQWEMAAAARACDHRCPACEEKFKTNQPLPEDCHDCGPVYIGVGGARGGAKSHWLFSQLVADDAQRFPGLKILYIRKSVTAAKEQIRGLLLSICGGGTQTRIPHNYREQAGTIEFTNGSYILVKHFKDEKDIDNFLGQEYDVIAAEELTTFTHDKWKNLMTCLRSSKPGWRPRFYGAWNWGGLGHGWVMSTFFKPWEDKKQTKTRYILALVTDNKHNNPEYINTLKSLTGWKYRSWFLGDPHFQAGQFFTNWREDWHVYPNSHVSLTPNNPEKWFGSFDYGFAHPTAFHLHCRDRMGTIYTLAEYHQPESIPEENAQNIISLLKSHHLDIRQLDFIAAGADCFKRNAEGITISTLYEDCGITLNRTEIDRVNAWAVMSQRLGDPERGIVPTWLIHKSCKNLIAQIPMLQNHETRAGDAEKMNSDPETSEGGDDAVECFVAGTMVRTDRGDKPIQDIEIGDKVLTSLRFKRVLGTSVSKKKPVIRVEFSNGTHITGTKDHPIWVIDYGWKKLALLNQGDVVTLCPKQSYSMAENSAVTRNPNIATLGIITGLVALGKSTAAFRCIKKFGNRLMGLFQKDFKSTTKTEIVWTTGSKTLIAYWERDIYPITESCNQKEAAASILQRYDLWQWLGTTRQKLAGFQKESGRSIFPSSSNTKTLYAKTVTSNLEYSLQIPFRGFATLIANKNSTEETDKILQQETARSVAQRFNARNSYLLQQLVAVAVVQKYEEESENVYNLSVEDCPEYFANGILVHNCARNGLVMEIGGATSWLKPIQIGQGFKPDLVYGH